MSRVIYPASSRPIVWFVHCSWRCAPAPLSRCCQHRSFAPRPRNQLLCIGCWYCCCSRWRRLRRCNSCCCFPSPLPPAAREDDASAAGHGAAAAWIRGPQEQPHAQCSEGQWCWRCRCWCCCRGACAEPGRVGGVSVGWRRRRRRRAAGRAWKAG